jgi:hypothetical protein
LLEIHNGKCLATGSKSAHDVLRDDEIANGVVLMGIDPSFRAHPKKTFRLLANAVYWAALQ